MHVRALRISVHITCMPSYATVIGQQYFDEKILLVACRVDIKPNGEFPLWSCSFNDKP